jgi:hypothetical protein
MVQSALSEILHGFGMAMELELKEGDGGFEQGSVGGRRELLLEISDRLREGEPLGQFNESNQVAAAATAMAVKQILASIDVEGGMGFAVPGQRTESDKLGLRADAASFPMDTLQLVEQRNLLFELLEIAGVQVVVRHG